ncbi:MAG UNVERIFIED_CONTAM: hypothetical protein LVT10_25475 [Anaerolineae bacterium]
MQDICYDEALTNRPNLCALVVRKSTGIPGVGFFVGMSEGYHDAAPITGKHAFNIVGRIWAGDPQP